MIELSLGCSEPPCAAPSPAKGRALAGDATQLACRLLLACAKMAPKVEITPWKLASGNGKRSASPNWKSMAWRTWVHRSCAAASSSEEISTALRRAPERATLRRPAGAGGYVKDVLV